MLEDKIINNNYDNVDYGVTFSKTSAIAVSPIVSDRYEESVSDDITRLYSRNKLNERILDLYENSKFYKKYKKDVRYIDRPDTIEIYYTFKEELKKYNDYSLVDIFCGIAEFFEFNYKMLYNDVCSIEDKAILLEELKDTRGFSESISTPQSKRLF